MQPRPKSSFKSIPDFLTPAQCEKWVARWDEEKAIDSVITGTDHDEQMPGKRAGKICWLKDDLHEFMQALFAVVAVANEQFYVRLNGLSEALQLTRYDVGDFYSLHTDIFGFRGSDRKLSFTVQLSDPDDYEGGEVKALGGNMDFMSTRGSLTLFPSIIPHEVTPVTRGRRWALVGWLSGPEWK